VSLVDKRDWEPFAVIVYIPRTVSMPTLREVEDAHIKGVVQNSRTKTEAARLLGIDRRTLHRKLREIEERS
jgi:DNA-binding NtrC family response regulator